MRQDTKAEEVTIGFAWIWLILHVRSHASFYFTPVMKWRGRQGDSLDDGLEVDRARS